MTTERVARADPRISGARKSLRTSVRGHSATQNVAWTHAVDADVRPALLDRHRPGVGDRRRPGAGWQVRLVGAEQLPRQVVGREHGLDLHLGVGEESDERSDLTGQCSAADLDRLGEAHLDGEDHVVGTGVRIHVGQQRVVGRGAGRRHVGRRLGDQIRPQTLPVVGEGCGDPLHTMHGRALAGERREYGGPRPDAAVLLVRARASEAPTAEREGRCERARRPVVHHAHVVPVGPQESDTAPRAHLSGTTGTGPPGAPAHRHGQPLVAGAPRHRHRRQRAVEHEDADGCGDAHRIGLPPQHQHAEHQTDRNGDDLAGPPPGQRATAAPRGPNRYRDPASPLTRCPLRPEATPPAAT